MLNIKAKDFIPLLLSLSVLLGVGWFYNHKQASIPTSQPIVFNEPEIPMPDHGYVENYTDRQGLAPFSVETPQNNKAYYVILKDASTDERKITMFIHPNSRAETTVPLGRYKLYTASGTKWYGSEHFFGPLTTYTKSDTILDFHATARGVQGMTVKLQSQINGNMNSRPASKSDLN